MTRGPAASRCRIAADAGVEVSWINANALLDLDLAGQHPADRANRSRPAGMTVLAFGYFLLTRAAASFK